MFPWPTTRSTSCMGKARGLHDAVRSRLAAAAKDRGDAAAAKQISASRKPTTAAWAVNRLALSRSKAKQRLTELGERLRAAHAAMDGDQIRELTAEQRRLIDELTRAALQPRRSPTRRPHCVRTSPGHCKPRSPTLTSRRGSGGWPKRSGGAASAISALRQRCPPRRTAPTGKPPPTPPMRTVIASLRVRNSEGQERLWPLPSGRDPMPTTR